MPSPTTPLLDAFTRANEDPVAGQWLGPLFSGGFQLQVISNTLQGRGAGDSASYWKNLFPANQECWVTLTQKWSAADISVALFLNVTLPGTAGLCGYIFGIHNNSVGGNDEVDIYRVDSGTFNFLKTGTIGAGGTVVNGSKFWGQNFQGVLSFYHYVGGQWVLITTQSDSTYGTGFIGAAEDGSTTILDDFGGGFVGHTALPPSGGHRPYPFSPGNPNYPSRF